MSQKQEAKKVLVFLAPKHIVRDYLGNTLMDEGEWLYFQPSEQTDSQRKIVKGALARALCLQFKDAFFYGLIAKGFQAEIDSFMEAYAERKDSPYQKVQETFLKTALPFFEKQNLYQSAFIRLKDMRGLTALLDQFWEDVLAQAEILVMPTPLDELGQNAAPPATLDFIHSRCMAYLVSFGSQYNFLLRAPNIEMRHLLATIEKSCKEAGIQCVNSTCEA